ncbi:MAG: SpoIIE family protein phosphatase [Planctomycetes bacterium]|nr:SpoIIE family protein phosphatase [Planctomycetota bacterium]MCB9890467.1 SpoIIE family protein phosphatase [Planctomycetota bacterium]MCB9917708.1 SpoIIE family protein phosphatase [Planctomycetota bacterium]
MATRRNAGGGIGLGLKSGLVVGAVTCVLLSIMAAIANSSGKQAHLDAAMQRGYAAALALAAPGVDGWFVEQNDKLVSRRGSQARIKEVVDTGAVTAWLDGPGDTKLRLHTSDVEIASTPIVYGSSGNVDCVAGRMSGSDLRVFRARLVDKGGAPAGTANIAWYDSDVTKGPGSAVLLWILAIVGGLAGIGAGFLASSFYTKPLGDLAQSVSRLNRGNLNYRATHRGNDELGRLSRALETMCDTLAEGEEAQERLGLIERETELLAELQTAMQPKEVPSTEGFEAVAVQLRGSDSGSDLYDAVPLDGGRLALFVASTSARGALGALLAGMTRAYLRSALEHDDDVGAALRSTNRNLAQSMRKGMHVTCQVAVLDPAKSQATVYIAGHRAPFYACRGGDVSVVHGEGLALGLDAGAVFDRRLEEVIVDMPQGTRIVLTTVGTYDFVDESGEDFGVDRFQELVRKQAPKNSEAFLNLVLGSLDIALGDGERMLDATIVTAKRMV